MDEYRIPPALAMTRKRNKPKGVITINRRKQRIEKYDDNLPVFSYNFGIIRNDDQQLEMPPMEE